MPQIPHEPFWSATIGANERHCVDVMLQGDVLQIGITNGATKGVKITLTDNQLDTLIRTLRAVQDKIHQHREYVQQKIGRASCRERV